MKDILPPLKQDFFSQSVTYFFTKCQMEIKAESEHSKM